MAVNTPDPATRAIATYLSEHPGPQGLDTISTAAGVSKPIAGKVLKQLVDTTPAVVRLDQSDPKHKTWAWALPATAESEEPAASQPADTGREPDPDKEKAAEPVEDSTKGAETPAADASVGTGSTDIDEPEDSDSAPERDADQVIMHAARTLAAATEPITTAEIAAAGYLSARSLHLLTGLRALTFHGLIDCSKPFEPDASDCTWTWNGGDTAAFLAKAAAVDVADAPDAQVCPTCGNSKSIPGIAKDRKRGGNVRLDGKTKFANNELADMVKAWIEMPENAGKLVKVNDVIVGLRKVHGDRISKQSYGSVSKAMVKLTALDPAHKNRPALLTHESDKPVTYRIRSLV
ncbi:hypothetical protein O1R50_09110 [Glycomyces luteolus]|uniref:Uncharacterized protein n=1 Tax=Glycomyces luteolus TaxID=2670330 RepID=A0A9X3PJN3_9ACTN|nr:hypothetical protein [Glycomyces luteolus]MDA1359780.1 hypothetical protein [Glycomyces luteolus]